MELDTARIMEGMNSISECYLANNTRTNFTDLVHNFAPISDTSTSQSHQNGLMKNDQLSLNGCNINKGINFSSQLNHLSSAMHSSDHSDRGDNTDSLHSSIQESINHNNNISNSHHHNNLNNHQHHSFSMMNENQHHAQNFDLSSRSSQPVRSQIPIHCYIEQFDACSELSGYSENDLFSTVNTKPNQSTLHNPGNHNLIHHKSQQTHQHQSKLALESVTRSSTLSSSMIDSVNPFSEQVNHNDEVDPLDNNLDQLDDDSPLSSAHISQIDQSTSQLNSFSMPSLDSNHLQAQGHNSLSGIPMASSSSMSSIDQNRQFQTCRETYAIINSDVLYIDLVRTVLVQLGYSAMDLINARATVQIKNWRPLALDQVTDDKKATVGQILGDISTFVTLRIKLYSSMSQLPAEWTETMIRQVVLALTQTMSQLTLSKLCNISQPLISAIVRGGKKLGRRKCTEFGQWYMNYIKSAEARPAQLAGECGGARLVFDKTKEIPQLKAWFALNTKPSDELLEQYSKFLNEHSDRKDGSNNKPPITAKALKNWWKNERQKLGIRQREVRRAPKEKRVA